MERCTICDDVCWYQAMVDTQCNGVVIPVARIVDWCAALYGYSVHTCSEHKSMANIHRADNECGYKDVDELDYA